MDAILRSLRLLEGTRCFFGTVAQQVELGFCKPVVGGSIPLSTSILQDSQVWQGASLISWKPWVRIPFLHPIYAPCSSRG